MGRKRLRLGKGVPEALLATGIFGVTYWALRYITPVLGGAQVALVGKVTDTVALSVLVVGAWGWRRFAVTPAVARAAIQPASRTLAPRRWQFWVWIVPAGALDIAANNAYNVGNTAAHTSVVVTI